MQTIIPSDALENHLIFDGRIDTEQSLTFTNEFGDKAQLSISPKGILLDRSDSKPFREYPEYQKLEYTIEVEHAQVYQSQGIIEVIINQGAFAFTEQF